MRKPLFALFFLGVFVIFSAPRDYGQGGRPVPPGVREADKEGNAPIDAPATSVRKMVDPTKLKEEAAELAKLSAAMPSQIDLVAKGQLPKDLTDQLKRIEKLAKHLRGEISP